MKMTPGGGGGGGEENVTSMLFHFYFTLLTAQQIPNNVREGKLFNVKQAHSGQLPPRTALERQTSVHQYRSRSWYCSAIDCCLQRCRARYNGIHGHQRAVVVSRISPLKK